MRNGLNPRATPRRAARFGDRSSTPCRSAVPPPPPTVRAAATAAATASATTVQLCSQTVPGPWRATAPATTRTRVAPTRECCLYVMASDSDSDRYASASGLPPGVVYTADIPRVAVDDPRSAERLRGERRRRRGRTPSVDATRQETKARKSRRNKRSAALRCVSSRS